ncbi:MAG: DUF2970 domain-containing protein [Gammaproteobacteria bacterium]|nr:DUF2970 domain-containing protein [Gammaproteobacteria bacterium]
MSKKDADVKITFLQVMLSVMSAFFGVQNKERRIRDFSYGKPSQFILAGIILTAMFVMIVFSLVQWVLSLAGV